MQGASLLKLCKTVGLLFQLLEAVLLHVPSTTGALLIPFVYSKPWPDWIVCFLVSIFPDSAALLFELSVGGKSLFCPPSPSPKDLAQIPVSPWSHLWLLSWNCLLLPLNCRSLYQCLLWYLLLSVYYHVLTHVLASLPDYKLFWGF